VVAAMAAAVVLVVGLYAGAYLVAVHTAAHAAARPATRPAAADRHTPAARPAPAHTSARPDTVVMPHLVGVNADEAISRLHAAGLRHVRLHSGDPRYVAVLVAKHWTVTAQSVPAGDPVARTTAIVLTCVKP